MKKQMVKQNQFSVARLVNRLILTMVVGAWVPKVMAETVFPFAPAGPSGTDKPDFAEVDHNPKYAISRETFNSLSVYDLSRLSQEQLDQIYARLTAGEMPEGQYDEMILEVDGGLVSRLSKLTKYGFLLRQVPVTTLFSMFWSGKSFYNQNPDDRYVYNRMTYGAISKGVLNQVFDFFGGKLPPRDSFWRKTYERFPGKVFCGASLLDSRRESIVIDYAYADDLKSQYLPDVDFLTGRNGFMIRNELRMVNRNIYLGRAYINRFFVFNYILSKKGKMNRAPLREDCWTGTQEQASK